MSGYRFTSIPVPPNVDIVSAYIQVSEYDPSPGNAAISVKVYAEDVDDATAFAGTSGNLTSRTLTTAAVDWDVSSSWTQDNFYSSPNISSVIQEVVDRGSWATDNAINILIKDDGSTDGNNRNVNSFDQDPTKAAKLDITYRTRTNTNGLFKNITLNNSAGMTLSSDVEIEGTLTLTSGNITTNSNTLTIASGGSVSRAGGKGCECVVGNLAKEHSSVTAVTYEVGDGTRYRPLVIAPASASSETYTVKYNNTQYTTTTCSNDGPGGVLDHIASSYYDISRANSVNANISIEWYSSDQVDDVSSLRLCHFNSGDSKWDALTTTTTDAGSFSGSGSTTSGRATATATSFSPFALGSSNSGNALPIDLISFTGECENGRAQLEFVVASQVNNDYYTIERSVDAYKWNEVGVIAGEGNTNTQATYNWTDDNPFSGVSYYRLAQTDYDGTIKRFDPIAVTCESSITGYSVYPNPANEVLNIDVELTSYQGDDVVVEIMDMNGRIVQSQSTELNRGFNHLEVDISEIPSGVYMINFSGTKDYIKESRIVKQ